MGRPIFRRAFVLWCDVPKVQSAKTKRYKRCIKKVAATGKARSPKNVCAAAVFHNPRGPYRALVNYKREADEFAAAVVADGGTVDSVRKQGNKWLIKFYAKGQTMKKKKRKPTARQLQVLKRGRAKLKAIREGQSRRLGYPKGYQRNVKSKYLRRSKKLFATARAAWRDIGDRTGYKPADVSKKAHTRTHWVFQMKSKKKRTKRKVTKRRNPTRQKTFYVVRGIYDRGGKSKSGLFTGAMRVTHELAEAAQYQSKGQADRVKRHLANNFKAWKWTVLKSTTYHK